MLELELGAWRKGRVWLNESLPATFRPKYIYEERTEAERATDDIQAHLVAIELRLMRGSRPVYGCLGATFKPNFLSQKLVVQVQSGNCETFNLQEVLAVAPEIVQVGLLSEYTSLILEKSLQTHKELNALPSGVLTFNCAIHGILTSNAAMFGLLSQVIVSTISLLCKQTDLKSILKSIALAIDGY